MSMEMKNGESLTLEEALRGLKQPEPSPALDLTIRGEEKQRLALANYQKAEELLGESANRLGADTRNQLGNGMHNIREMFEPDFKHAYATYLAQQEQYRSKVSDVEQRPEPGGEGQDLADKGREL